MENQNLRLPSRISDGHILGAPDPRTVPIRTYYPELDHDVHLIDHSKLPTRATNFMKKRFSSWNEVAENSVNELLNFIGVGIGTVESIVTELDRQIMAGLNTRPLDAYQSDRNIPPILNFRKFASLMEWAELHFSSTGVTLGALSQLDLSNLPAQVHAELENLLSFEIVKPEPPKRSIAAVLQESRERLEPRGLEIL